MSEQLLDEVRGLLNAARSAYSGTAEEAVVERAIARLDEPLRVAIAGKVKAGKSTLLNALVGERLAPTDASECTKIVTWYQDGVSYLVTLQPSEGESRQASFTHDTGAIEVDLGDLRADDVERIVVDWPSASLRQMTLVDTPGIASVSTEVSDRTYSFLTPADEHPTEADAVLYLMRHLHSTDLRFLESFHDEEAAQATPVNAIAVLSRADEIGVGRLDAMTSARRIAARYRTDPQVRRLCQTVIPVAGLLAETSATLREDEYRSLAQIAATSREQTEALLLSVDRFVNGEADTEVSAAQREDLIDRFGLFGLRVAIAVIRQGVAKNASELAAELLRRSGIDELREMLVGQFGARQGVLKARATLVALDHLLRTTPPPEASELELELERVQAGAHEFAELNLLNALRSGQVSFKDDLGQEAERILGANGLDGRSRLGLDGTATDDSVRAAAAGLIERWQRRAENPLTSREQADSARILVRSLEGVVETAS